MPITAEQRPRWRLHAVAGFKLPPMMFNDDEALALSVARTRGSASRKLPPPSRARRQARA